MNTAHRRAEQIPPHEFTQRCFALRVAADYHRAKLLELAANYFYAAGYLDAGGADAVRREESEFHLRLIAYLFRAREEGLERFCNTAGIPPICLEHSQPGAKTLALVAARIAAGPPPFTVEQILTHRLHPPGEALVTPELAHAELMALFVELAVGGEAPTPRL